MSLYYRYVYKVYRKNILIIFCFASFFQQLATDPIKRASRLLHQFNKPRIFNSCKAKDGLGQIL